MIEKAVDAASMFWQSLDERERQLLLLGAVYLVGVALVAVGRGSREQLRNDILDELRADSGRRD